MKQKPIVFSLFGYDALAKSIQNRGQFELGAIKAHEFPDEETLIIIESDVRDRVVLLTAGLAQPNCKMLPLIFAAETARSLGASEIILIAPYLAYMRQDMVFEAGQGITSTYFAQLISHYFDGLITVDPHLHRWKTLSAIYDVPTQNIHATHSIANWIAEHINKPLLIGPDVESKQWIDDIAKKTCAPYLVLEKIRKGDSSVEITLPTIEQYLDFTPVLIDDIVSTGMTMIETIKQLRVLQMAQPICVGVHAIFAGDAYQTLLSYDVARVITCNTIPHISNGIDISGEITNALKIRFRPL